MTCHVKILASFLAALLPLASNAVTADNPYHTIVDRNPFGLNPPVVNPTTPIDQQPANVKFNGIADVGGRRKAFFTIPGKDPKDPPRYITLAEAERSDVLEVTKIFKEEGEVEVINTGIKMVLNFKNNGNKGPSPSPIPVSQPSTAVAASPVYTPGAANHAIPQQAQASYPTPNANSSVVASVGSTTVGGPQSSGVVFSRPAANTSLQGGSAPVDAVNERLNMVANHMLHSAAYENGATLPVYRSSDPRVYSATPTVTRKLPLPPPPPLPPSPASLSALTGE